MNLTNIAMENGPPFEDALCIEQGDIPLLYKFARGFEIDFS